MRARGFSETDIAAAQRQYSAEGRQNAAKPKVPQRARDAKTPKELILNLLRGNGF